MTDKYAAEHRLTALFRQLIDAAGYEEALRLFDESNLNGDENHDETHVAVAEQILQEYT